MAEHADEGDRVNEQTKYLHGLRAADNVLHLVRGLVRAGSIKIKGCEIDLDNGEKHKLKAREYLELAEVAISHAIHELKARYDLPQPGRN